MLLTMCLPHAGNNYLGVDWSTMYGRVVAGLLLAGPVCLCLLPLGHSSSPEFIDLSEAARLRAAAGRDCVRSSNNNNDAAR